MDDVTLEGEVVEMPEEIRQLMTADVEYGEFWKQQFIQKLQEALSLESDLASLRIAVSENHARVCLLEAALGVGYYNGYLSMSELEDSLHYQTNLVAELREDNKALSMQIQRLQKQLDGCRILSATSSSGSSLVLPEVS